MPSSNTSTSCNSQLHSNLSKNHANLSKSLVCLSSGNRITQPTEDAGGLAVAYKLDSGRSAQRLCLIIKMHFHTYKCKMVHSKVWAVLLVVWQVRTMAADITKNTIDVENYSKEFRELQVQLNQIQKQKFNGVSLFTSNSAVAAAVSADFNSDSTASYQHVNDQISYN